MTFENTRALVIDVGSGMTKCGVAGDSAPSAVFPSIVPLQTIRRPTMGCSGIYVGEEAQSRRGMYKLLYPVERGVVANWDYMQKLLHHTFEQELHLESEEHHVLLTEPPLKSRTHREKMSELLMEQFSVPGFFLSPQSALAIFAYGCVSGTVLSSGYGVSHVVPILEGRPLRKSIQRIEFAGHDITNYLADLLLERGYEMTTSAEREIVRDIKERMCFVSEGDVDFELIRDSAVGGLEQQYELPDGSKITIDTERFRAPEALFQPSNSGNSSVGIHTALAKSIELSPVDKPQFGSVFLAGGSTLFEGLEKRLTDELRVANGKCGIVVSAHPERKFYPWIGGSILCSLSSFQDSWITKQEYDEAGQQVVNKKC